MANINEKCSCRSLCFIYLLWFCYLRRTIDLEIVCAGWFCCDRLTSGDVKDSFVLYFRHINCFSQLYISVVFDFAVVLPMLPYQGRPELMIFRQAFQFIFWECIHSNYFQGIFILHFIHSIWFCCYIYQLFQ